MRFYVKHHVGRTPARELPGAHAVLRVSTPEATVTDLVRNAAALGGIERVVETLKPMGPNLRKAALKEALAAEREAATAQRLGFILDGLGYHALAKTVRWCDGWPSLLARQAPTRQLGGAAPAPPKPLPLASYSHWTYNGFTVNLAL